RLTALIAALLLALCQLAFAAQACAHALAAQDPAAVTPCHEMDGTPATPKATTICDAPTAAGADISYPVYAPTDLPLLSTVALPPDPVAHRLLYGPVHVGACHSPPLTVLHCRFRN